MLWPGGGAVKSVDWTEGMCLAHDCGAVTREVDHGRIVLDWWLPMSVDSVVRPHAHGGPASDRN